MRVGAIVSASAVTMLSALLLLAASGSRAQGNAQPSQQTAPAAGSASQRTDQGGAIRQNVNLVNVIFSVFDQQSRIVSDLEKKNFRVFDGKTEQEIRFFSRQTGLPLRVGLLMDT